MDMDDFDFFAEISIATKAQCEGQSIPVPPAVQQKINDYAEAMIRKDQLRRYTEGTP